MIVFYREDSVPRCLNPATIAVAKPCQLVTPDVVTLIGPPRYH